MTYAPIRPSLGYIQATAVTAATVEDVSFDISNDMQTTEEDGITTLKDNCVIIMRMSRNNDGVTNKSLAYYTNDGLTDFRLRGRIPSESNNYFQISEDAFNYASTVEPTEATAAGSGNIDYSIHSHCRLWRLNT
jgi:hypothetical protein